MQRDNQFLVLRFGWLFMAGSGFLLDVVSEGLFRRPGWPECYCAVNNAHGLLPPISKDVYRRVILTWFFCIFCFHLWFLFPNRKRLGSLVRKVRQIHGLSRSASAWSAVFLVLIVRTSNICYGVWIAGCLSLMFVGLVNMVSAEEDALASTRWVLHQSFVSAVLVATLQLGWSLHVVYALVPALAALLVIFAHKYIPLPGGPADKDEFLLLLPVSASASDISSSTEKERSCYVPLPELDTAAMAMTTAAGPHSPPHLAAPLLSDNMKQPHAG